MFWTIRFSDVNLLLNCSLRVFGTAKTDLTTPTYFLLRERLKLFSRKIVED